MGKLLISLFIICFCLVGLLVGVLWFDIASTDPQFYQDDVTFHVEPADCGLTKYKDCGIQGSGRNPNGSGASYVP